MSSVFSRNLSLVEKGRSLGREGVREKRRRRLSKSFFFAACFLPLFPTLSCCFPSMLAFPLFCITCFLAFLVIGLDMGKAKKTRKFAHVKRVISGKDPRMFAFFFFPLFSRFY